MFSPTRARACAVLVCLSAVLAEGRPGAFRPDIQDLFDAYSTGHETTTISSVLEQRLNSPEAADAYYADLRNHIDAWPRERAAGFALESAGAAIFAEAERPGEFEKHSHFRDMVELACSTLERSAVTPFDRQWHLAAIAVLTGPPSDLQGGSTLASLHTGSPRAAALEALSKRLRERLPADPALSLAWGISREAEVQAWLYSWATSIKLQPDRPIPRQARTADPHRWLDDAAESFEVARKEQALRAEATLRLALTKMYQGQADEALGLWAGVPVLTRDASLQYLAHMFSGRTLAATGRSADAIEAYRKAAAVKPGAQSARIPLAALLYLAGDRDEAARLMLPLLNAPAPAADPWWGYTDQRVQERVNNMRRAVPR
jgi:tetratricopeptide (TPR) repeat protein